jgi:hypothetical protein
MGLTLSAVLCPPVLSLDRRERVLAQDGAESLTPLAFLPIVQAKRGEAAIKFGFIKFCGDPKSQGYFLVTSYN